MVPAGLQPAASDPPDNLSTEMPQPDSSGGAAPQAKPVTIQIKLSDGSLKNVQFDRMPDEDAIDEVASHLSARLPKAKPSGFSGSNPMSVEFPGPQEISSAKPPATNQYQQTGKEGPIEVYPGGPKVPIDTRSLSERADAFQQTMTPEDREQYAQDLVTGQKAAARANQLHSQGVPMAQAMRQASQEVGGPTVADFQRFASKVQGQAANVVSPVTSKIDPVMDWLAAHAPSLYNAKRAFTGEAPAQGTATGFVSGVLSWPADLIRHFGIATMATDATPLQRAGAVTNFILLTDPAMLLKPLGAISAARAGIGDMVSEGIEAGGKSLDGGVGEGRSSPPPLPSGTDAAAFQNFVAENGPTRQAGLLSDVQKLIDTQKGAGAKYGPLKRELVAATDAGRIHPAVQAELQDIFDAQHQPTSPGQLSPDAPPAVETSPQAAETANAPPAADSLAPPESATKSATAETPPPVVSPKETGGLGGDSPAETPAPARTREAAQADLSAAVADFQKTVLGKASLNPMLDPEIWGKALNIARYAVETGYRGLAEFAGQMKSALGEKWEDFKPYLSDLYKQAHESATDPVSRLSRAIRDAEPIQADWEKSATQQRAQQAGRLAQAQASNSGRGSFYAGLGAMKGAFERPAFAPIEGAMSAADIDHLHDMVLQDPGLRPFERINAQGALEKVLKGQLPAEGEMNLLHKVFGPDIVESLLSKRTLGDKALGMAGKVQRFNLLSSVTVGGKLGAATVGHALFTPVEEALQAGLKKVPGMGGLMEKAGYEAAGSLKAEGAAAKQYVTWETYKDAVAKLMTGKNSLDELYGHTAGGTRGIELQEAGQGSALDRTLNVFNRIHGAMKTPLQRSAFMRSFTKQVDFLESQRVPLSPDKMVEVNAQAYADSLQAILRNNNAITGYWQDLLRKMGSTGPTGKLAAAGLRSVQPIAGVATNFAGRSAEYVGGVPYGLLKVVMNHGIENMAQPEAAAVLRSFKRGGVGMGLMALGYFQPDGWIRSGGHYSPDKAKSSSDLKANEVEMFGTKLPQLLSTAVLHAPMLQALQVGADIRNYDSPVHAARAAALGVAESLPAAETAQTLAKGLSGSENEAGKGAGRYASGLVPLSGLGQSVGSIDDQLSDKHRSPKGFTDELKMVFPWWRDEVPEPKARKR